MQSIHGHNTFHGTGIIVAVTLGTKISRSTQRIKATAEDVPVAGKINFYFYSSQLTATVRFGPLFEIVSEDKTNTIDIMWMATRLLRRVVIMEWYTANGT